MRLFGKTLNVRLLAILLVSTLLVGAAAHGLHEFQVRRQAGFFLEQAEQAREKRLFPQALSQFDRYLRLRPDDFEALEEFGLLQAAIAEEEEGLQHREAARAFYSQAYFTLEKLLRLAPGPHAGRRPARRRLVEVAMKIGRFSDATEHLENYLLKETGDEVERVELLQLLARCQMFLGDDKAADRTLREIIQVAPDSINAYNMRARLLRERLDDPQGATRLMARMVQANPDSAPGLVSRTDYFYRLAKEEADPVKRRTFIEKAKTDAEAALDLEPENIDALSRATFYCLQMKQFAKAREHAIRGVELAPKASGMYLLLAETERNAGEPDAAIAAVQQGLEQLPDHADLLWVLATLSLNPRDIEQARETTRKLADLGVSEARGKYLEGGIAFWTALDPGSRGDWPKVREKLEAARAVLASSTDLKTRILLPQVDYWLGECHGRLGTPGDQVACYESALKARPSWTSPRIALARVLTAAGKTDEALEHYEFLTRAENVPASALIAWARLLVQRNLGLESTDRDWKKVDELLRRVEADAPASAIDLAILSAESLLRQEKIGEAKARLEAARAKYPKEVRLWTALVALAEVEREREKAASQEPDARDMPDRAAEILIEAQLELGDQIPLRIARARHLVRQLRDEVSEESRRALQQLASDVDDFSDAEKAQLWRGLLEAWVLVDQMEEAKHLCHLIRELQPKNLPIRLTMLELVRRTAKDGAIQQALQDVVRIAAEIDKIEGSGPHWRYAEAMRLWLTADQTPDQDAAKAALNQALEHLKAAEELLSSWASVPLLAGAICDLLGQPDATLKYYRKAIESGSRDLAVLKRTTQLLDQKGLSSEVDKILRLMKAVAQVRGAEFPMGLEQQLAESSLRAGESVQALEEARKIAADSDDFNDHVWLARVLITVARPEPTKEPSEKNKEILIEAEQSLRHALELAPEEYRPRAVLIRFLGATGRIQEAEEALREARQAVRDPDALVRLLQDIGNWVEVAKEYEAQLANGAGDTATTLALIDAYVKARRPDRAEPLLRKIRDGKIEVEPTTTVRVRLLLAEILVRRGGYANLNEAAEFIRENLELDNPSLQNKRSLANVLSRLPEYDQRAEAIGLLEELVEIEATPADQFLLARLYSTTEGNWPKSRERMLRLLTSHGDQPQYVASYVEALLDRKEISDAALWLRKLNKLLPNNLASRGLRARLFVERKQFDAAVAHVTDPLAKPELESPQRERLLPVIASQLEQLAQRAVKSDQPNGAEKLAAKAEALYREYVETSPEEFLRLASFLGRQNRPLEALELIEKAPARSGGSPREPLILADFHIALERFDEVEALYRKVLGNNPDDVIALNNLAVLLALEGKQLDEALQLIERAIELAGAGPIMLDSRATVYLARKELPEALADIEGALLDPHTPTRLFHLAQIKDRMNDEAGARQALEAARELDLEIDQLHPLERPGYDELNKKLNSDG